MEDLLKLFETFREFLIGLTRLFLFWPDGHVLMRRTVAWCRTRGPLEAWIAYWLVGSVMYWATNLLQFAATKAQFGNDAPRLVHDAAVRAENLRHLSRDVPLWQALQMQSAVMFDPGQLLALNPMQLVLTAALQALAIAAICAVAVGSFIRFTPRLRSSKKQAQSWAMVASTMPLIFLPILFGQLGEVIFAAIDPLPLVSFGLGAAASMALLVWGGVIGQRAFRLKGGRTYWLLGTIILIFYVGFSLVGGFAVKPYAEIAKVILRSNPADTAK